MNPTDELTAMKSALDALSPLSEDARSRAISWLISALEVETTYKAPAATVEDQPSHDADDQSISAKDFMLNKAPDSDVERVACLGWYLTFRQAKAEFNTRDLTTLNIEAGAPKITNPTRAVDNATTRSEYFISVGRGKKKISALGEAVVNALPDREEVKRVIAEISRKRKKPSTIKKAKTVEPAKA